MERSDVKDVVEDMINELEQNVNVAKWFMASDQEERTKRRIDILQHLMTIYDSYYDLLKAVDDTEWCCPYDNTQCSKTNCFINGGNCARRSKGPTTVDECGGLTYKQIFIDEWMAAENMNPKLGGIEGDI